MKATLLTFSLLWNTGVVPPDIWRQLRCLKVEHSYKSI